MSATSGVIVDLDGGDDRPAGADRRRAVLTAFALCLAIGAVAVGRDGPAATAPNATTTTTTIWDRSGTAVLGAPVSTLALPPGTADARLFTMPDRLTNEPLANLPFVTVRIRGTEGLGVRVGSPEGAWVMWTEGGTAYWLSSEHRDLGDLVDLAGSLR
jgi:hypothetical protein